MDFTGMKPSEALKKAHEAYPHITWHWTSSQVYSEVGCGCAAALLTYASDQKKPRPGLRHLDRYFPALIDRAIHPDSCVGGAWHAISHATREAKSFHDAIQILRNRGW